VPDLIAKPALGTVPLTLGQTVLAEAPMGEMHSIQPYPGQEKAVSKALKEIGLAFPKPNSWLEKAGLRIVWTGREQAFLLGGTPPTGLHAAVTDQSDGWVTLTLEGPGARDVLARLVPLDLRHVKRGDAARSSLGHMPLILIAEAADRFCLMTFRSMARTAWHEIHDAMTKVEARRAAS
jgi:sarcosine oxidase subunit gamma